MWHMEVHGVARGDTRGVWRLSKRLHPLCHPDGPKETLIQEQNKSRQCLLCFVFSRQALIVVQTGLELVIQSQSPQEVLGW